MRPLIIWVGFALLVSFELGWFVWPRDTSLGRDDYRFNERSKAYITYSQNGTTNNWNEVEKELELDAKHEANRRLVFFSILLVSNVPIVFLVSKYTKVNKVGSLQK